MKPRRNTIPMSGPLAVLAVAMVTACAIAAAADSPKAAATPAKVDAVTLRVDWLYKSYHAPFFLGVAKGWYKEAGIDLTINEGRGSGSVIQLVGNKSDTFGFAGADAVVRGVQNSIPVVSVATILPQTADTILVLKNSGITRPQELKGKAIATTTGGTSDVLLPAFLKGAGLAVADVRIIPVDVAVKAQVLLQGKVDAMNGPIWSTSLFASAGGVNSFPYADYGVQVVGYGIVTHTETTKVNPELIARFVAATMRGWEYARQHPEEALVALEKVSAENAKPDAMMRSRIELSEVFNLVKPAVPGRPLGTQNESDWERMQTQLFEYGVIKERRPVGEYMTNRFVR